MVKQQFRKQIEEIAPLSDDEFEYIYDHFDERRFKKHQFIVQEGMPVPNDFWVVEGCLKAFVIDDSGKEHILHFAMENWWISDYQAYFNQDTATVNIDCIEDCKLLTLSLENRRKICREFHQMDRFFSVKFNFGYIRLQERILSLLTQSAKERYRELLDKYPELVQRVPKKYLAAYLGLSRETLSRVDLSKTA